MIPILSHIGFIIRHPVGRRRPIRCLTDWAKWQITASSQPQVMQFIEEARFFARRGETGVTGNIYVGLHEFIEMAFLLHYLRRDEVFLDVGANVGAYTILASKCVGARTIAVEPVPETAGRLMQNIRLNEIEGQVSVVETALGANEGTVMMTCQHDTMNRVVTKSLGTSRGVYVNMKTVDGLCKNTRPVLIKIDVEGYAIEVLKGAHNCLRDSSLGAVMVELFEADIEPSCKLLSSHGFRCVGYDPWRRSLSPRIPREGNNIFVRNLNEALNRVRTARRVQVKGIEI